MLSSLTVENFLQNNSSQNLTGYKTKLMVLHWFKYYIVELIVMFLFLQQNNKLIV